MRQGLVPSRSLIEKFVCRKTGFRFTSSSQTLGRNASAPFESDNHKWKVQRTPVKPHAMSPPRTIPVHIDRPAYASTGVPTSEQTTILLHTEETASLMRDAAVLARRALDVACASVSPGVTTDSIDAIVHSFIIEHGAYPSPMNYMGFPKSCCSSVNEIICHGIPDSRKLQFGDVVSFDVSCFFNGVHGDNCGTVIVGDIGEDSSPQASQLDWRGVPFRTDFETKECRRHFEKARALVQAAHDTLYAGISMVKPGGCLSDIGAACQDVADAHGFSSVSKYRGHGIGSEFHTPPFVEHCRNEERLELVPGMIFTIEPMICEFSADCFEWDDKWTVSTIDSGLAAQFEHTVLVTESGVEILTLP